MLFLAVQVLTILLFRGILPIIKIVPCTVPKLSERSECSMEVPIKVSLEEFDNVIENFKSNCYERRGVLYHNDCDTKIKYSTCNISIHNGDSCESTGEVATRMVPYCPECDESYQRLACVHEELRGTHPFAKNDQAHYRLFVLLSKLNLFSLLLGGAGGALITYLFLHH